MLKKIKIKNYQSHRNTTLDLHPGVNIVVGNNNNGKSAIFRCVNWVVNNRPASGRMLSDFSSSGEVHGTIEDSDGNRVELSKRIKITDGKKTVVPNSAVYKLNGKKFSGFGQSVPDLVQQTLNMNELNIQPQLDGPFLIASSPAEVARTINRIIHLDDSEDYIKAAKKRVNKVDFECSDLKDKIKLEKEQLKSFEDIEVIEDIIVEHDNAQSLIDKKTEKLDDLAEIIDRAESIAIVSNDVVLDIKNKYKQLIELISDLSDTMQLKQICQSAIELDKKLRNSGLLDRVKQLLSERGVINDNLQTKASMQATISKLIGIDNNIKSVKKQVKKEVENFRQKLLQLKICPICSNEIDEVCIEKLIGNYL